MKWVEHFGLENSRLRGNLIALYSFLRTGQGNGGAGLFLLGFQCASEQFRMASKQVHTELYDVSLYQESQTGFLGRSLNAPSLSVFIRHLDNTLNNVLQPLVSPEFVN